MGLMDGMLEEIRRQALNRGMLNSSMAVKNETGWGAVVLDSDKQQQYNNAATLWNNTASSVASDTAAFDPNTDPAYAPALSTLKDMWHVKWGETWVAAVSLHTDDPFWVSARDRLLKEGCLESCRYDAWYRIKE